ncbi:hypothetical protein ABPG75_013941 [Micractinium tetrahymenae]
MRVIVLGAGGRLGSRALAACVHAGHDATAFVRSADRLQAAVGGELLKRVRVVEGDASDAEALAAAMEGHEACIQAAGYLGDKPEQGLQLQRLVATATQVANASLVGARRLWVLGLAGALNLPGRRIMLVDVPGFPFPQYRAHKHNLAFLQRSEFDSLDWSFACPGMMTEPAGGSGGAVVVPARVTVDELPVKLPPWAALLPPPLLLPAVAAIRPQLVGPSYEEVAAAMVQHLAPNGPLRHRRVSFAAAA